MRQFPITSPLDWDDARMVLAVARAGQMLDAAQALDVIARAMELAVGR